MIVAFRLRSTLKSQDLRGLSAVETQTQRELILFTYLLPIGLAQIELEARRILVPQLTVQHIEHLPDFTQELKLGSNYEEQIREVYDRLTPTASSSVPNPNLYHQDPKRYTATGEFRELENQLLAKRQE